MIFPNLGPTYLNERDRGMLSRMEAAYAEAITINQSFWSEADQDTRFEAGDQTLWNDIYGNLPINRRKQFNFNRIRRVVNMIGGHQRKNRKSTIVTGVENFDNDTADQLTKILFWIHNTEGVLNTISDSFHGSLVTGMNLMQVWVDYRSDPVSGNIKVDNCSYNSFLIDPFFRKADLSDCNFIWKRSFLTKRECISLMPDHEQEILGLQGNDSGSSRDGKFQFMPESYNYGMKNLLTYDEYYYRDYRKQKMLVDAETGETLEWRSQDEDALKEFMRLYPQVTMIESDVPTVKLSIVIQGKVMYDGPNPMGIDKYPFVPVFAYYNPQMPYFPWRIQGVVRGLRDSQYLYNRRKAIELDILESQINSGWKYKENALVNPKDIFMSGQGRGLALKDDAQMTDVEQIIAPAIPQSMIELSRILGEEISQISGVNEELLGSAVDDKAGILSMLRQGAGLTTLQVLFDNLDRAQKLLGGLMIDIIQANFTPGKVKKILEGEEPTPQFYNKAFGKYDAVVEEGLNTTTQKQMQFAQLLQMREAGIPVPDDVLLEASTMQNKKELIEAINKAQQQQAQMQQQQMQSQMQLQQAQANLANARAAADQGLGLERISRVEENQALAIERRAQAVRDEDAGLLDKVRALKELEEMDIVHLEKLIALSQMLKQQDAESVVQKDQEQKASVARLMAQQMSLNPNLQPQGAGPQQAQSAV
jgi:hypothetical protein